MRWIMLIMLRKYEDFGAFGGSKAKAIQSAWGEKMRKVEEEQLNELTVLKELRERRGGKTQSSRRTLRKSWIGGHGSLIDAYGTD